MRSFFRAAGDFMKKADILLLLLCVTASVFGIVAISSATNYGGNTRSVLVQSAALVLGILIYIFLTLVDVDVLAERRELLLVFCALFISMLFVWGDTQQGNRSWLSFRWLPFYIQPAEICKVFFILILAKTMSIKQNKISAPLTVLQIAGITVFFFALIMAASEDLGVALQYLLFSPHGLWGRRHSARFLVASQAARFLVLIWSL